jgi:ATP-binding cassette subfamily B protein
METVIQQADLIDILETLPDGPHTRLGESGGLVSGGEGQRVRLGRAMLRPDVRLVIMDEPFRGLDRPKRQTLLRRSRQYWDTATLLFISHDISEALTFDRVFVIEDGHLVEDAAPKHLIQHPQSRYRMLLEAEEAVQKGLWESTDWRRLWLEDGQLHEEK